LVIVCKVPGFFYYNPFIYNQAEKKYTADRIPNFIGANQQAFCEQRNLVVKS
jgi:hypothetical protein